MQRKKSWNAECLVFEGKINRGTIGETVGRRGLREPGVKLWVNQEYQPAPAGLIELTNGAPKLPLQSPSPTRLVPRANLIHFPSGCCNQCPGLISRDKERRMVVLTHEYRCPFELCKLPIFSEHLETEDNRTLFSRLSLNIDLNFKITNPRFLSCTACQVVNEQNSGFECGIGGIAFYSQT